MDFSTQIVKRKVDKTITDQGKGSINSRKVKYICALGILLLCSVMLLTLVNDFFFESDEGEIFSKGSIIAQGRLLYKDFASQHMPVAYYVAALFSTLGASSVLSFRLCFYVVFMALWAMIMIWYGDEIPKLSIALCPILYIIQISRISLDTAVLSEHFQSMGIAILFFELMLFYRKEQLSLVNCVRISFAIFLSFGSAFTTIFPIFFLAITVAALEVKNRLLAGNELTWGAWGKSMIRRYLVLVGVVAAPFVVLCVYYLITGSLDDFIYWAYKFNVDIYSKYQNTGSSILQSLFAGFNNILEPIRNISADPSMLLLGVLTAMSLVSVIVIGAFSRSVILPLGLILMLNGCETRCGISGFHAIHAVMLQSVMTSYVLGVLVSKIRYRRIYLLVTTALLLSTLLLFGNCWQRLPSVLRFSDVGKNDYYDNIDLITDEGEPIGVATLQEGIFVYTKTVPASVVSATVKWMWDGAGEQAMRQLRANPPRVYIMDEDYAIWGYPMVDYAQELIDFVHENYTSLSKLSLQHVYVLNSYYQEAYDILKTQQENLFEEVSIENNDKVSICVDSMRVRDNKIEISGWAVVQDKPAEEVNVFVLAKYKDKSLHLFKTRKQNRSDVASALQNILYTESGFSCVAQIPATADLRKRNVIIIVEHEGKWYTDASGLEKTQKWGILSTSVA